jgi:hypothetical protein
VVPGQHRHKGFAHYFFGHQPGLGQGLAQEAHTNGACAQLFHLGGCGQLAQAQVDVGEACAVKADDARHRREQRGGREAYRQQAGAAVAHRAYGLDGAPALGQQALGFGQQGGACGCELHPATGALKQAAAQHFFQPTNLLAKRGLFDAQLLGGLAKVQVLGYRQEVPQPAQLQFGTGLIHMFFVLNRA